MLKALFGKKSQKNESPNTNEQQAETNEQDARTNTGTIQLISPLKGKLLPISEVPDQVFSEKMMGDGFAIDPEGGEVISPIAGKVVNLFPTKHAIGLESENGTEILIHVGVDTVNLKGEGFESFVSQGDTVTQGQKLLQVNFDQIRDKVPSIITPIVFTNLKEGQSVHLIKTGAIDLGESDFIKIDN